VDGRGGDGQGGETVAYYKKEDDEPRTKAFKVRVETGRDIILEPTPYLIVLMQV